MTKKLLIFIAIFAVTATLFAENETVSCESDYGTCSLERSDTKLEKHCFCHNGNEHYVSDPVIEGFNDGPLTEEWCQTTIDNLCKKIDAKCSNEAGACNVNRAGEYKCYCSYVDGKKTGSGYFGKEGCNEILVETCGSETPTPRKVCPEGILNECVSYFERIHNTCLDPIDIYEILDTPITYGLVTVHEFADCCRNEYWRNEYKREYDCMERFKTCADKECCVCTIQVDCGDSSEEDCYDFIEYPDSEEDDVDNVDKTNAEAPTTAATPENTADGDFATPATGSETPAENKEESKEESKSDGCSMLFV